MIGLMSAPDASIIGREPELEVLVAFLARRDDLPAGLLIQGEAGIGKTTLWQQGVARAEQMGYRVLSCRPAGAEVELAFAALSDLFEGQLDAFLPALPAPQRRALEVALLLRADDGPATSPTSVPSRRAFWVPFDCLLASSRC